MKYRWILGLVILIVAIVVLSVWGFKNKNENINSQPQISGESQTESYFSEEANVMYFYQDSCSWCLKEKEILQKLGAEGYKVKSMNVGNDAGLWQQYNIKGTPTFMAKNSDRLEGYQEYEPLKNWLEQHK